MTPIEKEARKIAAASRKVDLDSRRFKVRHCRRGTKIGSTGARFGDQNARVNGRMARPDQVVVQYGNCYELTGLYPLVAAIKEAKK